MTAVVVTGAAGGIGRAIVERLSPAWEVVATDVAEGVRDVGAALTVVADLTAAEGRAALLEAIEDRPLQALVNVAGITRDGLIANLSDADVRAVVRVNTVSPIQLTLGLADRIVNGGAIVSLSSRAHLGNVGQVNYAMSKGALIGATVALARALAPRVRVNAVAPGLIRTPMTAAMPEAVLAKLVGRIPLARMGEPADVAATVGHLIGADSAYVTGQVVYVCGGRSV